MKGHVEIVTTGGCEFDPVLRKYAQRIEALPRLFIHCRRQNACASKSKRMIQLQRIDFQGRFDLYFAEFRLVGAIPVLQCRIEIAVEFICRSKEIVREEVLRPGT